MRPALIGSPPPARSRFGNMPEQFAALMKAEQVKWGMVVRAANIKVD